MFYKKNIYIFGHPHLWFAGARTVTNKMNTFHGQRTCTLNMREHILDDYYNITHNTIVAMLQQEDYLQEITTIQISTCHRFASICFTNREIRNFLPKRTFTTTKYLCKI